MSQHQDPIVIVSAARTPMGAFMGDFADLAAHDLGGAAIKAAVERAGIAPEQVDEVLFGNCLMAGQGQAPARQAGFKGGLPQSTGAVTLSKMCGAGMEATILAHDQLIAGSRDVMIAGGMESMTNAPYLLKKGRAGYRMGHDKVYDHMMLDGLEDAYEAGRSMGTFGDDCAAKYQFTREQPDAFAIASVQRAQAAASIIPATSTFFAPACMSRFSRYALSPAAPAVGLSPESERKTVCSGACIARRMASSGSSASTVKRTSCRAS